MTIRMLDHLNIHTPDVPGTAKFFADILGLKPGPRPDFPFPGAWLYAEGGAVVHLVEMEGERARARRANPPKDTGAIDHIAFAASDFDEYVRRLKQKSVDYEIRDVPGGKLRQIFFREPNGALIELVFGIPRGKNVSADLYATA